MKKYLIFFLVILSCKQDYGNLTYVAKLPKLMEEVSGIQYDPSREAFWMLNDSGNSPSIYLVTEQGKILKEIKLNADNIDFEDISQDKEGNLYVGNFGNNFNNRKDLQILKISKEDLEKGEEIEVRKTFFSLPEQTEFPPKKMYYDMEGFFEWNGFFYLFTKSRVKKQIGRTFLYRIPNKEGAFQAERISDFTTCKGKGCWITGADISDDGKIVALLNHKSAWVFTNFKNDDFFSGDAKKFKFKHNSQKESITFKSSNEIYLADEDESGFNKGRNLYSLEIRQED